MKKIIASALLFIVTVLSVMNSFAKVDITKENLQEAYNEYAKKFEGGYTPVSGGAGIREKKETPVIKVEDKELVYEEVDEFSDTTGRKLNIKYDLSNKPTFSYEITINKDTTLEEMYNISDEMKMPIIGVIGSAIVQGVKPIVADSFRDTLDANKEIMKYTTSSYSKVGDEEQIVVGDLSDENNQKIFKSGETDNFEYLEYAVKDKAEYKEKNLGFYTYTFTKTKKSDTEYVLKAEIVVDLDADISSIIEKKEDNNEINNNETKKEENKVENNTVNNNVVARTITLSDVHSNNTVKNSVNNTVNKTSNKTVNNIVNTSTKGMPYVGTDTTIPKLICVFLAIAFINAIKLRSLDKKDND